MTVRQQIMHAARLLRGQQQEDQQCRTAGDGAQQQVVPAPPTLGHNDRPANSNSDHAEMAWKRSGVSALTWPLRR